MLGIDTQKSQNIQHICSFVDPCVFFVIFSYNESRIKIFTGEYEIKNDTKMIMSLR